MTESLYLINEQVDNLTNELNGKSTLITELEQKITLNEEVKS